MRSSQLVHFQRPFPKSKPPAIAEAKRTSALVSTRPLPARPCLTSHRSQPLCLNSFWHQVTWFKEFRERSYLHRRHKVNAYIYTHHKCLHLFIFNFHCTKAFLVVPIDFARLTRSPLLVTELWRHERVKKAALLIQTSNCLF